MKKILLIGLVACASQIMANEINLDERVVSVKSKDFKIMDVPGAVNFLSSEDLNKSLAKVNLSEVLDDMPGVLALDRGNFARDLALSIRGFGTRSATSGIRGQQIFIDGIPLTLPDGQSQSQNISLSTAGRIDVIKGPLATLYGNASGGVIQIYSKEPEDKRYFQTEQIFGSWNQYKNNYQLAEKFENTAYLLDYSSYKSDGFRLNSQIQREHFNAIFSHQLSDDLKLKLSVNLFDEPYAYDPRTLTLFDALNNPEKSTSPVADRLRKITQQNQYGQSLDYQINSASNIVLSTYFGDRFVQQFATPSTPTSSARFINSERDYSGVNLAVNTKKIIYQKPLDLNFSIGSSSADELYSQGVAQDGEPIPGVLRLEKRKMSSSSATSQATFYLTDNLNLLAGLRKTNIKIRSDDRLQQVSQGALSYDNLGYVLGALYYLDSKTSAYLNYGVGFETPTLTELSYTRVGNANQNIFNTSLKEAKNSQYEIGLRSFGNNKSYIDLVAFSIKTKDEIAVDLNPNGSTISYKNIPEGTTRNGLELSYITYPTKLIRTKVTGTMMQAEFDASYFSGSTFISAGNRVPGVPKKSMTLGAQYSNNAFIYAKNGFLNGWLVGYDMMYMGNMYTSDANNMQAPSYVTQRLQISHGWNLDGISLSLIGRINNIFDKRYISSVQVSNPIPFEPGAPRNWLLGLRVQAKF